MKASDIKKGSVIEADGAVVLITELQVQTASSRSGNTLYKVRGRNVLTRQKFQGSFKGDDTVQTVELERRPVQFLYQDAEGATFMDRETFEQHTFDLDALEAELPYLTEGLEGIFALVVDGRGGGYRAARHRHSGGDGVRPRHEGRIGLLPQQARDLEHRPGGAGARVSGPG